MAKIKVTQTGSTIATPPDQRKTIQALGLGRIGRTKTHKDNNCLRGMLNKVKHLVSYTLES